jgi:hypothetical protein
MTIFRLVTSVLPDCRCGFVMMISAALNGGRQLPTPVHSNCTAWPSVATAGFVVICMVLSAAKQLLPTRTHKDAMTKVVFFIDPPVIVVD